MIIKLTEQYIGAAFSIIQDVINSMHSGGIDQWDEIYPDKTVIEKDIVTGHAFGCLLDTVIVGYVAFNNIYPPEYDTIKWNISGTPLIVHRLAVRSDKQNSGIGKDMMLFAEQYAKICNCQCIRFDAFVKNPAANSLYVKLGYQNMGTVEFRKGPFNCYEKGLSQVS